MNISASSPIRTSRAVWTGQIPVNVFQLAGLVACLAIYAAHLQELVSTTSDPDNLTMGSQAMVSRLLGWAVPDPSVFTGMIFTNLVFAAFVLAMMTVTRSGNGAGFRASLLVGLQVTIGVLVNNDLLLLVAAQLPFVFRLRRAIFWMIVQSAGMALVWGAVVLSSEATPTAAPHDLARSVGLAYLMFLAWQSFAFCLGYIAMSERINRNRLSEANAQLRATQTLLSESARTGERLRIARDLHDGLGHHLTALRLHLDLATRQGEQDRSESVATASKIANRLLTEVRQAVGRERQSWPLDISESLAVMFSGIPSLQIQSDIDPECTFNDPDQAHTVFRAIQEAVSNTLRHADAHKLHVSLLNENGGIAVLIRDDGKGVSKLQSGNGLSGMRERIKSAGGNLSIMSKAGSGLELSFWLPREGAKQ